MSYRRRGLGQAKIIPGQVNMLAVRESYEPFRTPGYIEHGSWVTGEPDVVAWGRPDGAGLQMFSTARRARPGLGQVLTDWACSGSALNTSWTERTRATLDAAAQAAVAGGLVAGIVGGMAKKPVIGAIAGGVLAFTAFKVWTAPYIV